ncbi:unnamed protein product [Chilo suppressalis]|uniref:FLYWCH-type domain-containing protein n=1 Tax=Chilo suppressalis TaxID=168631 RepID=A0ABN8AW07_CHISP|nr:unnamed protein product [Chilo suppressalis]
MGSHRYKFMKARGKMKRWLCIKTNCKCSAFVNQYLNIWSRKLTKNFFSEPKFELSQRGNLVVQIGEWRFNKHACWGSKVRWTCIKKKTGCTAAITTVDNVIVKTLGKHNH